MKSLPPQQDLDNQEMGRQMKSLRDALEAEKSARKSEVAETRQAIEAEVRHRAALEEQLTVDVKRVATGLSQQEMVYHALEADVHHQALEQEQLGAEVKRVWSSLGQPNMEVMELT